MVDAGGSDGLLAGTRVLDLGLWRPVPHACALLADLGADVIKVEPPAGDPMRAFPALYTHLNGAKRVLRADLRDQEERARVVALAGEADVVAEGFRPGVAERLGLGAEAVRAINPRVVYCSVSGFGQDGPLAGATGHDLTFQAWSGALAERAPELHRPGLPIADLAAGAHAAFAITAALAARGRTGKGERIDVSMADVLVSWVGPAPDGPLTDHADPGAGFPAYGTFDCADGALTLAVVTEDAFWASLCRCLGLDDIADDGVAARVAHGPSHRARIADALIGRRRDQVVEVLLAAGVPVAPVLDRDEAQRLDHFAARGTVVRRGEGVAVGHPVRLTSRPAAAPPAAPPGEIGPDDGFAPRP